MSCGCNQNGLTSCGCTDNCPYKTSDITLFDGQFSSIVVPDGAGLNEVLELLEQFTVDTVTSLNLNYTLNIGNCLGLPAGTYGYNQIFDALNSAICDLQSSITTIEGDITTIEGDIVLSEGDITTIQGDITNINSEISTGFGENMPVGSIIMWPTAVAPNSKWLICEGQSLSTITYADLFAVVQYDFGGAGPSFKIPDMRTKFIAGYDNASPDYGTIGSGSGLNDITLTNNEIPAHQHIIGNGTDGSSISNPGDHNHRSGYSFNSILEGGTVPDNGATWDIDEGGAAGPIFKRTSFPFSDGEHIHTGVTGDGTTDGLNGNPFDNRPEFIVFPFVIKALV
jgi:microcystin-dependent protein